ncbi:MAG: hypothetical protein R6V83_00550 [Candidatus Thorarchaeota archaeon]
MEDQPVPVPNSRLFGDLVLYLVEVFDRKPTGEYRPYKHVEAFCEHNSLNTERVCGLLQANGAYNDVKVLLNCLDRIAPYRQLPVRGNPLHNSGNSSGMVAQEG